VLGAFLPSFPGRARDAHPQIKTPPGCPEMHGKKRPPDGVTMWVMQQ